MPVFPDLGKLCYYYKKIRISVYDSWILVPRPHMGFPGLCVFRHRDACLHETTASVLVTDAVVKG